MRVPWLSTVPALQLPSVWNVEGSLRLTSEFQSCFAFRRTEVLAALHAAHGQGRAHEGVNTDVSISTSSSGKHASGGTQALTLNAVEKKIFDHHLMKQWAIRLGTDAALTVLRVDQIIMARPAGGPAPRKWPRRWSQRKSLRRCHALLLPSKAPERCLFALTRQSSSHPLRPTKRVSFVCLSGHVRVCWREKPVLDLQLPHQGKSSTSFSSQAHSLKCEAFPPPAHSYQYALPSLLEGSVSQVVTWSKHALRNVCRSLLTSIAGKCQGYDNQGATCWQPSLAQADFIESESTCYGTRLGWDASYLQTNTVSSARSTKTTESGCTPTGRSFLPPPVG